MCRDNTPDRICGIPILQLLAGKRMQFGAECRTAIQDHIINNRLTPTTWDVNFETLMDGLHLSGDQRQRLRSKVESRLRASIREFVEGGLIGVRESEGGREVRYQWREDADAFLGRGGWIRDFSRRGESTSGVNPKGSKKNPKGAILKNTVKKPMTVKRPSLPPPRLPHIPSNLLKSKKQESKPVTYRNSTKGRGHIVTHAGNNAIVIVSGSNANNSGIPDLTQESESESETEVESDDGGVDALDQSEDEGDVTRVVGWEQPVAVDVAAEVTGVDDCDSVVDVDSGIDVGTSPEPRPATPPPEALPPPSPARSNCSLHPSESASNLQVPNPQTPLEVTTATIGTFAQPDCIDPLHLRAELAALSTDELLVAFDEAAEVAIDMAVLRKRVQLISRYRDVLMTLEKKRDHYCWLAGFVRTVLSERLGGGADVGSNWWWFMKI